MPGPAAYIGITQSRNHYRHEIIGPRGYRAAGKDA